MISFLYIYVSVFRRWICDSILDQVFYICRSSTSQTKSVSASWYSRTFDITKSCYNKWRPPTITSQSSRVWVTFILSQAHSCCLFWRAIAFLHVIQQADKLFPKIDSVDSNVKHYVEAFDITATNAMCTIDSVVLDGKNHLRTHVSCDIHRLAKLRICLLKESRSCPRVVAVTVKR